MQTRTWKKIGDFISSCFTLGEKRKVSLEQESFYSADTRFLSWSNRWKFSTGSRDMNVNSGWGGRHQFVYERITRFEENFVIEEWNLLPDQIKRNLYNFDSTTSPARFCRARELLVFSPGTGIQLRGNRGKSAKSNTSRKWVMTRSEVSENQFSTAKSITIKSTRRIETLKNKINK